MFWRLYIRAQGEELSVFLLAGIRQGQKLTMPWMCWPSNSELLLDKYSPKYVRVVFFFWRLHGQLQRYYHPQTRIISRAQLSSEGSLSCGVS
jgi:hypothetical protein